MTEVTMMSFCIFSVVLSALVIKSQGDAQCHLKSYNVLPLTKSFWAVPIPHSQCRKPLTDCAVYFSLCHYDTTCPPKTYACVQQEGISSTLGEAADIKEKPDGSGFVLTYSNHSSKTSSRHTIIEFICNPEVQIKTNFEILYSGKFKPESVTQLNDEYHIVIACDIGCKQQSRTNIGAQLMITLLIFFLIYFCIGIIYNHVNGARGVELIPHHWFWMNLPNQAVDGCIFVVRLITCQIRNNYSQNPDYGATSPAGISSTGRTYEAL